MNILYGVQATGNGHINRSREVVKLLRESHNVEVIFSGREEEKLKDIDEFNPYRIYKGITYKTKNGAIDYLSTIKELDFIELSKDVIEYSKLHDLVITDFEPITSKIAQRLKIKSIGLAHQYNLSDDPIQNLATKIFAPADIEIGINWWHFGKNIIPPIISRELIERTKIKNKILVYLPWSNKAEIEKLKKYEDFSFIVYDDRDIKQHNNIKVNKLCRVDFIKDLSDCDGVICNAGFQLASEAISLNKKVFVIPLKGQFEQEINAKNIKKLCLGISGKSLDHDLFYYWLYFVNQTGSLPKNSANIFVDWINNDCKDIYKLIEEAWRRYDDR